MNARGAAKGDSPRRGAALALIVAAGILGCASSDKRQSSLDNNAADEARGVEIARRRHDVQPPPGVDASLLLPRNTEAAAVSLDQVLAGASSLPDFPTPPPPQELSETQRLTARRAYARGRHELVEGRLQEAVRWYQQVVQIDPHAADAWRALGRIASGVGNQALAYECWRRLLALIPTDREGLIHLGYLATMRRDYETALSLLGTAYAARGARPDVESFLTAQFLARSLRELGHDRAFLEIVASESSLMPLPEEGVDAFTAARLGELYRARSEHWRAIGDAHVRLRDPQSALAAYAEASNTPSAEPDLLRPRIVYALLQLGRGNEAQRQLAGGYRAAPDALNSSDIDLARWMKQHLSSVEILQDEVATLQQQRPEDPTVVRLSAALAEPGEALRLLRSFASRRGGDLGVIDTLMRSLADRDLASAAAFAAEMMRDRPTESDAIAQRYLRLPYAPSMLEAAATDDHLRARLRLAWHDPARAWAIVQANPSRPGDVAGTLLALDIASALEEPELLRRTSTAAIQSDVQSLRSAVPRAYIAAGDPWTALRFAEELLTRHPGDGELRALRLRALTECARLAPADRRMQHLKRLETAATEEAVTERSTTTPSIAVNQMLIEVHDVRSGLVRDPDACRVAVERIRRAEPENMFVGVLAAGEEMARGETESAVGRLLRLAQADPADPVPLQLLVESWDHLKRHDDAITWVRVGLARSPADPNLADALVSLLIRANRADEAEQFLRTRLAADATDSTASWLLEQVCRKIGKAAEARELAKARISDRPDGPRRTLALAALALESGSAAEAFGHLSTLSADAELPPALAAQAVDLSALVAADEPGAAALARSIATAEFARNPDAAWPVLAAALSALQSAGVSVEARQEFVRSIAQPRLEPLTQPSADLFITWMSLAQTLADREQPSSAAILLRALRDVPGAVDEASVNRAATAALACHAAAGEWTESLDLVKVMVAAGQLPLAQPGDDEPGLPAAIYRLSSLHTLAGDKAGAEALLTEQLRLTPNDAMARNNLAYSRLDAGDDDPRWAEYAEFAFAAEPDSESVLDTVGWLRYLQNRLHDEAAGTPAAASADRDPANASPIDAAKLPGAITLLRRSLAASESTPSAEVYDHLGDALWRAGDRTGAEDAWRTALRIIEQHFPRREMLEGFAVYQQRDFGLRVITPERFYDHHYGRLIDRLLRKLAQLERGEAPDVTPQFKERRTDEPENPSTK